MAPTFAELMASTDKRGLVRKANKARAFLAPVTETLPEALTDTTGAIIALPTGYLPVGIVTPDGYTFGNDVEKDDIDALGYASPIRSDITRVARSISFTAMETGRKHMLELQYGTDLSAVTQAASGEVVFEEPDLPVGAEYRLLVIASDGPAGANWLIGRGYPRVKLASVGETSYTQEGALQQEFTLDVFTDDDLGFPVRHYIGGTGAKASAADLGFTQAGT